jgi:hypothetical protein
VLWTTSDVRVAVVTAGGWVAALGRGQVVLTASCGLASGSVTIYVEQAKVAPRPAHPRKPPVRAIPASAEAEPAHRSSWRRRGVRTRRRILTAGGVAIAAAGSLWLVDGARDFRPGRAVAAVPAETIPSASAALGAAIPDSIPPINRGTAPVSSKPRPRRAGPPPAATVAGTGPVVVGDSAGSAGDQSPLPPGEVGPELSRADTAVPAPSVDAEPEDAAGYVPMQPYAEPPVGPSPGTSPGGIARGDAPAPAAASARPPEPPVDRRQLESRIREGVEECYHAVRSKDLDHLARMYQPQTVGDEDKLRRLTRILRTEPWEAVVGRRVDGVRELGTRTAAAEFSFRLAWRNSLGGRLSSQPIFRAEFTHVGEGWAMSSCRIVGSPKL